MSNPIACPFDGYVSSIEDGDNSNNGQETFHVVCPICRCSTPHYMHAQTAVDAWNLRRTATYVTWLALAATEAGVAADVPAMAAWIVANPPVEDVVT